MNTELETYESQSNNCPKCATAIEIWDSNTCDNCGYTWYERILVVLDIDETLVHATDKPPNENWDFKIFDYAVYKRPGLASFLEYLLTHFDVGVWSSASDDYVAEIVKEIFPADYPLQFVWGRSRCTRRIDYNALEDLGYFDQSNHLFYTKRLAKLKGKVNQKIDQILIIDDTPEKAKFNYGNAIYPKEFTGDSADIELDLLQHYLEKLKAVKNVRGIEKRGWRALVTK